MKKFFASLLSLLVICPIAFAAEIQFRDIPWGSSPSVVMCDYLHWDKAMLDDLKVLEAAGKSVEGIPIDPLEYYYPHNVICDMPLDNDDDKLYGECGVSYTMYLHGKKKSIDGSEIAAAGHALSQITLEFIYNDNYGHVSLDATNSRFVKAEYEFYTPSDSGLTIYDDVFDKLIWLYGEPANVDEDDEGKYGSKIREVTTVWYGDNNTQLVLHMRAPYEIENYKRVYEIDEMTLTYGLTTIDDEIQRIEKLISQNERDEKYNSENTDGL